MRPEALPTALPVSDELAIEEFERDGRFHLKVTGELDLASVPVLRRRLEDLYEERRMVLLDLSELSFIDSTGLHLIIEALGLPQRDGWGLRIAQDLSPQVQRLFQLVGLDRTISGQHSNGR